jgi:lipid II:glycine glycyltransferase (peptidoglycan interpeptide bridge formation enzyme)
MEKIGWLVEDGVFIKKLPLIPYSFIKLQRPNWPVDLRKLERVAKKHRAIQVKIEPNVLRGEKIEAKLKKFGYKKDSSPLLPTKTIWLDLHKNEQQLLKNMSHKTRYNIKKFSNSNFQFSIISGNKLSNEQFSKFYKIYKKNCRQKKFWGLSFKQLKSLFEAFGKKSYLLIVEELGGLVLLIHDRTAYYSHNAATVEGKKRFVPTVLTWEAIKLARRLGCWRFDFEGISDHRFPVTKKWRGFSRFKKGFGGREIEYVGSFVKTRLW